MQKILIIQTAFLGDVILATPVLSELKRKFPEAVIDCLVRKGNESLLSNNPNCATIYLFDKKQNKIKSLYGLIKTFRTTKYDLIINLHRFASSGIITAMSQAKRTFGFKKNPFSFAFTKSFDHQFGDGTHEVERNLSLISEFGAVTKKRPELFPTAENFARISEFTVEPFYCIAPASVWFTKQLPREKWIELINTKLQDHVIYLLGGKDDYELCAAIQSEVKHSKCINLAGKLNLLESAALISKARRTFANDSGPLHISSAMNAPITSFFCSTITDFGFGPLSDDFEIKEVKNLACRPCGIHGHKVCPEGHFRCGRDMRI